MNVVGGHQRDVGIAGDCGQLPVAVRVSLEEVLLEFHVDRVRAEPVRVVAQELDKPHRCGLLWRAGKEDRRGLR